MRKKKRILSLALAAGVAASALSVGALAAEDPYQIDIELPPVQYEELSRLPGSLVVTEDEKTASSPGSVPNRQGSDQSAPAQETASDDRLKIKVKQMGTTEQLLLFQEAVTINLKPVQDAERKKRYLEQLKEFHRKYTVYEPGEEPVERDFSLFPELWAGWRASGEDGPALSQEMLLYLCLVGVMQGGDGSFQLDRPVTQGEFVKMTVTALGLEPEETPEGAFWAEGYVKKAADYGWVTGSPEDFDYGKTVSWQEAQVMLAQAMGRESVSELDLSRGADVDFADQPLFRNQTAVIFCNFLAALADAENQ